MGLAGWRGTIAHGAIGRRAHRCKAGDGSTLAARVKYVEVIVSYGIRSPSRSGASATGHPRMAVGRALAASAFATMPRDTYL